MLIFLIFALLAGAAMVAVCWPALRKAEEGAARAEYDQAIFRDQLAELDRDRARGLIAPAEADAARNEIARRLIAAAQGEAQGPVASGRNFAFLAAATIPVLSMALYLVWGAPQLPDVPLERRLANAVANNDLPALLAKAEAHLAASPNDLKGWEVLVPLYRGTERYAEAAEAYRNIIRLNGPDGETLASLGEMLVLANAGLVPKEAAQAFADALKRDPHAPKARFYEGLALKQDGRTEEALRVWRALLADTGAMDSWRPVLEQQIALLNGGAPALSPDQVATMETMAPQDREKMIRGMVEGLEQRLKSAPADLEGWQRLIRARAVLGEMDKARQAYASAREQFKADVQASAALAQSAKQLGID